MTAIVLMCSQLLVAAIAGPLMVQCEGGNDHVAIEIAHSKPCDKSGPALSNRVTVNASAFDQLDVRPCVDTNLDQPPVMHPEQRSVLALVPVFHTRHIAELPEAPLPVCGVPAYIFSPDSAKSLARNVILLI
tara:strand:+ start:449 stop:844 length:396 start_codon:yes stop_codon:yes gene_type:complete